MTPIEEILDMFYSLIKDTEYGRLPESVVEALSINHIRFACVKFKECKKDLSIVKNDEGTFINSELTDEEICIIAYGATQYYLEPKIKYSETLKNKVNTKDFNNLSTANILRAMYEVQDLTRKEFARMRRAYGYKDFKGLN